MDTEATSTDERLSRKYKCSICEDTDNLRNLDIVIEGINENDPGIYIHRQGTGCLSGKRKYEMSPHKSKYLDEDLGIWY